MNRLGRRLLCGILAVGLMAAGMETGKTARAESDDGKGGYLTVFVAQYEYNMGVEHAQFPSGNYTDNRRTDVLYYALSRDGINYKGMNRDRAVYYPDDMRQLGSPSVFKKVDGTYGMIASDNNKSSKIILSDSDDLLTFSGDRMKNLNSKGIVVTDPEVEYSEKDNNYNIYWSSPDGENYVTKTTDFESFSEPELTSHERKAVTGTLPVYAKTDEASVYKLDEDEYNRIEKKYGNIHSVSIKGAEDISVKPGEKVTVPDKLQVVYSDASKKIKVVVLKKQVVNKTLTAVKSIKVKKGSTKAIVIKKLTAKTTSLMTFKSADKKIAAVDKYGVVTGKKNGKTTVRVVCGKKKVSIRVNVTK